MQDHSNNASQALTSRIKDWGRELGFQQTGISDIDLAKDEVRLERWLELGMHGQMKYMSRHGTRRSRPNELEQGTIRVISLRMDYLPGSATPMEEALADGKSAYVSRYATGRDYHKLMRKRLQKLAERIESEIGPYRYRAFVDSAPVLEKAIARKAGLGWIGKHSNLINPKAGSWFFLGEIYTDLPLQADEEFIEEHCGECTACMTACPTDAIVAPYVVDARRCISYLTIELRESIPEEFRAAMGNRIYGCDDCQMVCPWNRFATPTSEADFAVRHKLDSAGLVELFSWTEEEFLAKTEGSAIRRIGYDCWLRNIAVALGNGPASEKSIAALENRKEHPSALVREHVGWALARLRPAG